MNITKEQYLFALTQNGVLNERRIEVLLAIYEFENCKATSKQIGQALGKKLGSINLSFGTLGHKISDVLDILPEKHKGPKKRFMWWTLLAEGEYDTKGFNWILKTNLIDALIELGYFSSKKIIPEELNEQEFNIYEGAKRKIIVNSYERNSRARKICLQHHKPVCKVCSMDFKSVYGSIGKDYMHVHHLIPLHKIPEKYKVDPIKDLIPVCPNCHAMLHQSNEVLTVEDLKSRMKIN